MKNILIVHNFYKIPGGEDTVVNNEIELLKKHGNRVYFYSRDNEEINGIKKISIPFVYFFNPRTYFDVKKIIKEKKIEIVHVHNTLSLIGFSVYYAAIRCGVPVVQTVHNFRFVCPGATFYCQGKICEDCLHGGLQNSLKKRCYRNSLLQTATVAIVLKIHKTLGILRRINYICLTQFTKTKLSKIITPERIFVKPNFVYDYDGDSVAEDYYIFVGRLEEIKGIRLLVAAFEKMPERKLLVVGRGGLYEEIAQYIKINSLSNITLLGFKDRKEVNGLLKKAKALIMCSQWYETFGMVIAEAYSNGVPAIVSNIGNIKDLVVPGFTGELFEYNSSESLIAAIERFERNCEVSYSNNAYSFYKKKLTPENNYEVLMNIYNEIESRN